jgi:hypothetical protein
MMNIKKVYLVSFVSVATLAPGAAHALVISSETVLFESRPGTNVSFATAAGYVTNWNSLPTSTPGYGNATIGIWNSVLGGELVANHTLIAGGVRADLAELYQVTFTLSAASTVAFRLAPDFGFGGAVFLDNAAVAYRTNDMWWNYNWYYEAGIQTFQFASLLSAGSHTLLMYGQEDCCDGATAGEYSINGGNFTPFTSTTPLPAALPLFATGLGFLGLVARRRRTRCMSAVPA